MAPGLNEYVRSSKRTSRETVGQFAKVHIGPTTLDSLKANRSALARSGFDTDNESIGNTTVASLDHVPLVNNKPEFDNKASDFKEDTVYTEDDPRQYFSEFIANDEKEEWQAWEAAKKVGHGFFEGSPGDTRSQSPLIIQTPSHKKGTNSPSGAQKQPYSQYSHLSTRASRPTTPHKPFVPSDKKAITVPTIDSNQAESRTRSRLPQEATVTDDYTSDEDHEKANRPVNEIGSDITDQSMLEANDRDHTTTSLHQSPAPEGDYSTKQLQTIPFSRLTSQPFEEDPHCSTTSIFPSNIAGRPLKEKLAHISAISSQVMESSGLDQDAAFAQKCRIFFSTLPMDQYDECGDLLMESVTELLGKFKETRRERRRTAMEFEGEIVTWEGYVHQRKDDLEADLARLKKQGEDVVKGRA